MNQAIAGGSVVGRPFDAFKSIQFHPSNILTSASFNPPPHKTLWQRFVEFICRSVQP